MRTYAEPGTPRKPPGNSATMSRSGCGADSSYLGRAWFRRVQVGVVLERLGSADADGAPETIRAVSGASTVTLVGSPSELMLYAHGRTKVAEIKLVGEPEAIEILNSADLRT